MPHLTPYLALASLPAAWLLALNPIRFSWGLHRGFEPMPVAVRDKAESVDRYFIFAMYALAVGFVVSLMSRSGVHPAAVGLRLEHCVRNVAIGVAAGASLILIQILLARLHPNMEPLPTTDRYQRRSVGLWITVGLVSASVEEFWIAFCLVTMRATGHSVFISVMGTAAVFGALHFAYRLGGALSVSARGVASALLFLWMGSLITTALFHFIGGLGNLYWLRRAGGASMNGAAGSREKT